MREIESSSGKKIHKKDKVFFSFEENAPIKKNEGKEGRNSAIFQMAFHWHNHEFKNILFNPNLDNAVFYNHLLMTFKGSLYAKSNLIPQNLLLSQKLVKLIPLGSIF